AGGSPRKGRSGLPPGAVARGRLDRAAGVRRDPAGALSAGVRLPGARDKERTTLTGRTHRDNIDRYVPLLVDAYTRPAFDPRDFERLKSDAINDIENTLRYASDEELAKASLDAFVFAGTRYAHPPEGTVQGLRNVTLDDVREHYRRRFTRRNVTIGLAGGFDDALAARMAATRDA